MQEPRGLLGLAEPTWRLVIGGEEANLRQVFSLEGLLLRKSRVKQSPARASANKDQKERKSSDPIGREHNFGPMVFSLRARLHHGL